MTITDFEAWCHALGLLAAGLAAWLALWRAWRKKAGAAVKKDVPDELIDGAEVARRLKVKQTTVMKWARAGKIPSVKASPSVIRFNWPEVLKALGRN